MYIRSVFTATELWGVGKFQRPQRGRRLGGIPVLIFSTPPFSPRSSLYFCLLLAVISSQSGGRPREELSLCSGVIANDIMHPNPQPPPLPQSATDDAMIGSIILILPNKERMFNFQLFLKSELESTLLTF